MHGFVQMQWFVDLIDVCCARNEVRKYKCVTPWCICKVLIIDYFVHAAGLSNSSSMKSPFGIEISLDIV